MSLDKEKAIKRIQAAIRSHLVQKKYGITQLSNSKLVSYKAFLFGNDMPLSQEDLQDYQMSEQFLLVGTSIFRSIDFACKLATSETIIPKVVIIDNSLEVYQTWQVLKKFFAESSATNVSDFLSAPDEGLFEFILDNLQDMVHGLNPVIYFKQFFRLYSLEYVKTVVAATTVIRQDWTYVDTFVKIQRIYSDRPIVAYPSNIISCISDSKEQCQVLESIDALKPTLCIYSNLDKSKRVPTVTHVLPDPKPDIIARTLDLKLPLSEEKKPPGPTNL
jgi:hypothetical protein